MTYRTAEELGILEAEREALIHFVKSAETAEGQAVRVNGALHWYVQQDWGSSLRSIAMALVQERQAVPAALHSCETAGCLAYFVLQHHRHSRNNPDAALRGMYSPHGYGNAARQQSDVLADLYSFAGKVTPQEAAKVVDNFLCNGEVDWG